MDCRYAALDRIKRIKQVNEKKMKALVELIISEDYDDEWWLPFKYEVCSLCNGKGTHVNPNIDSHGICAEEWDELGSEFQDEYINGFYDVQCYGCNGKRVEAVICENDLSDEEKEHYNRTCKYDYEEERERAFERRMRMYGSQW